MVVYFLPLIPSYSQHQWRHYGCANGAPHRGPHTGSAATAQHLRYFKLISTVLCMVNYQLIWAISFRLFFCDYFNVTLT